MSLFQRGKYVKYTDQARARIGKYASENGNEKARQHFLAEFPKLHESSIRNFKKMYLKKVKETRSSITSLPIRRKGRPPLLLELDDKLINYLRAIRNKGGIVNIHVVRAAAEALIKSNPSLAQHFCGLAMPQSWVQSIYRRMGLSRRLGTTARPPIPRGIYDECRLEYLRNIDNKVKLHSIPPELILNADQTPSSYVFVGKVTVYSRVKVSSH